MELKVSDDQFRDLVQKAIFETISPEERDELLRRALGELLKSGSSGYGKESFLESRFRNAVERVMNDMISELIERDEPTKVKIRGVVTEAFDKAFSEEKRKELVEKASGAIGTAMFGSRY